MKKIILLLTIVIAVVADAMAQNNAMYVYRNDGMINAFLKSDIDSMRYSCLDLDSVSHKEYVTQEVWTVDSLYRIPLSDIDSVSFVTPPTVYKEAVTDLSNGLINYVLGADGKTLKLRCNTPSHLLPSKDDILVLLEVCDVLPNGFSGKVNNISNVNDTVYVVCDSTYIEDIFKSFCSVITTNCYSDENTNNVKSTYNSNHQKHIVYNPKDQTFNLGPYTMSAKEELSQGIAFDGDLALKGGTDYTVTIKPTLRVHTFLIIGDGQGVYFNSSITGNLSLNSDITVYGGLEWSKEFLNPEIPIPIIPEVLNFYFNPGLFLRASATITSHIISERTYSFIMNYNYSSKGDAPLKNIVGGRLISSADDVEGFVDGNVAGGAYIETGFSIGSREVTKACFRGEYGWQVNGHFMLKNSDIDNAKSGTKVYEALKASKIEVGPFANAAIVGGVKQTEGSRPLWELSAAVKKWDVVPTFANTKLTLTSGSTTSADAYTELAGDCLFPVSVGYKLFDKNNNELADYNATNSYTNKASCLDHTFTELTKGEKYTVYPKVNLFGYDILATPSAELNITLPQITSFEVTKSSYSKGAYYNDGRTYYYRFNAATTVEIESVDGVSDWGYVYKDPYGNIEHISLMSYGTSFTDTRYAYYRNEAKSTACLYPFVRYEGNTEYYYGEPTYYDLIYEKQPLCPDDHHPHAIDLGLPSGTKWCCCNVGATTPENYGGYYAWGETSEKSVYDNWGEYAYGAIWDDHYQNIGSDIAGTSYDAAHVNMGGSWVMPSETQQQELIDNCSVESTEQNGVNGYIVTGPNGGKIFLPNAGYREDDGSHNAGSLFYYWSSSLYQSLRWQSAYILDSHFRSGRSMRRDLGLPVRAVCP